MTELFFYNEWLFDYILLPLMIFLARISDVTIDTLRLMFVARGDRKIAPILGFCSVFIWVVVIAQIMQHLDNILCYIAYAGGFAAGNYIGITLEERLSIGDVLVRMFPRKNIDEITTELRNKGFGITLIDTEGVAGKSKMILSSIKRKDISVFVETAYKYSPNAFYTIEVTKKVSDGIFTQDRGVSVLKLLFKRK